MTRLRGAQRQARIGKEGAKAQEHFQTGLCGLCFTFPSHYAHLHMLSSLLPLVSIGTQGLPKSFSETGLHNPSIAPSCPPSPPANAPHCSHLRQAEAARQLLQLLRLPASLQLLPYRLAQGPAA